MLCTGLIHSKFTFSERTTRDKGISGVCFRAAADRGQTSEITVGSGSTSTFAWVLADSINTGRSSTGAIPIAITFWPALGIRASDVSSWAFANCAMVARDLAISSFSALVASVYAFKSGTMLLMPTL